MAELTYDVDPAHVANCDKPLGACAMCASVYGLRALEDADRRVTFAQNQLDQARAARERLQDRWEDWDLLQIEAGLE